MFNVFLMLTVFNEFTDLVVVNIDEVGMIGKPANSKEHENHDKHLGKLHKQYLVSVTEISDRITKQDITQNKVEIGFLGNRKQIM